MCVGMCEDMRVGMCVDMRAHMFVHMHMGVCLGLYPMTADEQSSKPWPNNHFVLVNRERVQVIIIFCSTLNRAAGNDHYRSSHQPS